MCTGHRSCFKVVVRQTGSLDNTCMFLLVLWWQYYMGIKNYMSSFTLEVEWIYLSSWNYIGIVLISCAVRAMPICYPIEETWYRETTGVVMDSLLPTLSNILFSKRIFFPAGFALVACVGIIVDGTGWIFSVIEGQGYLKNRVMCWL